MDFIEKDFEGKRAFVIKDKLKMMKVKLRWWNTEVFGWVDLHLEKAVSDLNLIEVNWSKGEGFNYMEELEKSNSLSNYFLSLILSRESLLSQKVRVKLLREGDTNSMFFHRMMSVHNKKRNIIHVETKEGRVEGVLEVKVCIKRYF